MVKRPRQEVVVQALLSAPRAARHSPKENPDRLRRVTAPVGPRWRPAVRPQVGIQFSDGCLVFPGPIIATSETAVATIEREIGMSGFPRGSYVRSPPESALHIQA